MTFLWPILLMAAVDTARRRRLLDNKQAVRRAVTFAVMVPLVGTLAWSRIWFCRPVTSLTSIKDAPLKRSITRYRQSARLPRGSRAWVARCTYALFASADSATRTL